MCGIVGFWGGQPSESVIRKMASAIIHRGPDDEGFWIDPAPGIALAHRRLSIVDLSPTGHQPMISACKRYVLIFNGEIYNFRELRKSLVKSGHEAWRGHSDTEVLLAAIASWGIARALKECVGMFALALWDRQKRELVLARDRIGEKPLYFGRVGSSFAFASELKALRAHPDFDAQVNRGALALMMRHSYIPAPHTIYSNIQKLQPGCYCVLGEGEKEPRITPYWNAGDICRQGQERPFTGTPDEAVGVLDELLRQSIERQMIADVPLGAFLSGGIDSSVVVALMQSISNQPVKTFTIGFNQKDFNEAEHAKQVAKHLGTDHTELYVTEKEAMDVIPRLPSIYCEPFSDSSQIPTFLVSEMARRSVTVSLSGDGGDELFSGYTRYDFADQIWSRLNKIPVSLRRGAAHLATRPSPNVWNNLAKPLLPFIPERRRPKRFGDKLHKAAGLFGAETCDSAYTYLVSHWQSPNEIVIDGIEPSTMLTGLAPVPDMLSNVERMMYLDIISYLPDDILVKVDRAAMASSLETRVPMLDHRIVEFAAGLPLAIKRKDGQSKWPLRQLLYRHIPRSMIERPKMGFGVPIDSWLRGPLRDWAENLLDEQRLRNEGFFKPALIREAWREHLSGRRNMQYLLWNVLMFQAWHNVNPGLKRDHHPGVKWDHLGGWGSLSR